MPLVYLSEVQYFLTTGNFSNKTPSIQCSTYQTPLSVDDSLHPTIWRGWHFQLIQTLPEKNVQCCKYSFRRIRVCHPTFELGRNLRSWPLSKLFSMYPHVQLLERVPKIHPSMEFLHKLTNECFGISIQDLDDVTGSIGYRQFPIPTSLSPPQWVHAISNPSLSKPLYRHWVGYLCFFQQKGI